MQCHTGRIQRSFYALKSTTALSTIIVTLGLQTTAMAQSAPKPTQSSAEQVEEVVVTGSRIVREGYESPTPLAVVSEEQLKANSDSNIVNYLSTQPVFTGSSTSQNNTYNASAGFTGVNSLNLRSLGTSRTLVLLDGRRLEPATTTGAIDVSSLPTQLMSRVDVVTGGASAVYGSDAIAGVVNFVIDKKFTGIKGEVNGGLTSYGDGKNYTINLAGGTGFADDRGHVLISGEMFHSDVVAGKSREWGLIGTAILNNPNYTATNGQPQFLQLPNSAYITGTPGGIVLNANGTLINSGPLARIAFGRGGVPYTLSTYGTIVGTNGIAQGGQWQTDDQRFTSLLPEEERQNLFTNVTYDVTDNITAYAQFSWAHAYEYAVEAPYYAYGSSGPTIKLDNAFLPASVRSAMVAAGVTQIKIGTFNQDTGTIDVTTARTSKRYLAGVQGKFDAFGSNWNWDASYERGETKSRIATPGNVSVPNYMAAVDSIVNPANGSIQCRTLATNPGCAPWNVFGTGVNDPNGAAAKYIHNVSYSHQHIAMDIFAASLTGEPFTVPAGPVSVALDAEHRRNSSKTDRDPVSDIAGNVINNTPLVIGSTHVTEAAFETVVPLFKGLSWADNWDVTGAARFTSYNLAGDVVTWKVGTTYSPIPDIKFRASRSRDIRAPTASENFDVGAVTHAPGIDPKYNTTPLIEVNTHGNVNLKPEDADNLTVGVVLQPSFLDGFSFSADYWTLDLKNVINPVSSNNIIAYCLNGVRPDFCANVTRDPVTDVITRVVTGSINFASQKSRGLDLEASYRTLLDGIGVPGELALHANMTFNFQYLVDTGLIGVAPIDYAGNNATSYPPNWRVNLTTTYSLDPVRFSLTARAFPGGTIFANYIQCTSGCPAATAANPTINTNRLAGAFYLDTNLSYDIKQDSFSATVFLNVKNLLDRDPPQFGQSLPMSPPVPTFLYDLTGRVFRAGVRFKI